MKCKDKNLFVNMKSKIDFFFKSRNNSLTIS